MSLAETARQETFKTFNRQNPEVSEYVVDMLRKVTQEGGRHFTIDLRDHALLSGSDLVDWLKYEGFNVDWSETSTISVSW